MHLAAAAPDSKARAAQHHSILQFSFSSFQSADYCDLCPMLRCCFRVPGWSSIVQATPVMLKNSFSLFSAAYMWHTQPLSSRKMPSTTCSPSKVCCLLVIAPGSLHQLNSYQEKKENPGTQINFRRYFWWCYQKYQLLCMFPVLWIFLLCSRDRFRWDSATFRRSGGMIS